MASAISRTILSLDLVAELVPTVPAHGRGLRHAVVLDGRGGHGQGDGLGAGRQRCGHVGGDARQFDDLGLTAASAARSTGASASRGWSTGPAPGGGPPAPVRLGAARSAAASTLSAEIRRWYGEFHLAAVHGGGVGDLLNCAAASGAFGFEGQSVALDLAAGDGVGGAWAKDVAGDGAIGRLVECDDDFQSIVGGGEIAGPSSRSRSERRPAQSRAGLRRRGEGISCE